MACIKLKLNQIFLVTKEWLSYSLALSGEQGKLLHNCQCPPQTIPPRPWHRGTFFVESILIHIPPPQEAKPYFELSPAPVINTQPHWKNKYRAKSRLPSWKNCKPENTQLIYYTCPLFPSLHARSRTEQLNLNKVCPSQIRRKSFKTEVLDFWIRAELKGSCCSQCNFPRKPKNTPF